MTLFRSIGAVATASGDGPIDWDAVTEAATAGTPPGRLDVGNGERARIAADVRSAVRAIREETGLSSPTLESIELQDRHHWIRANVSTFRRVLAPVETRPVFLPGLANRANTGTMAVVLSFLGRNVLGQYDPTLFSEAEPDLYLVYPNLREAATTLEVDYERFRRWIVFHEVTHAVEFGAAPWLADRLETRIERAVGALGEGELDTGAIRDVDATMTVIEGYAEYVMDRAFDAPAADLREKLDARRRGGGPITVILRRLLGLGIKRRQYERGRRFFEDVEDARGVESTTAVWRDQAAFPTAHEITRPERWIDRVDP